MEIAKVTGRYWTFAAIVLIIFLGTYARTFSYSYPFLRNVDSYNFVYEMQQILDSGHIRAHDNLSLAPNGLDRQIGRDLYPYIMAYTYSFAKIFSPNYALAQYLIWSPALLIALVAIPMYFIGKMLYDRRTGVMAAFFTVFNLSIVSRTLGADPGRNSAVIFFSITAIALFLYAYKHVNAKGFDRRGILYTAAAGIGLGIWGFVWIGFWYVVWLLGGFVVAKVLIEIFRKRNLVGGIKFAKRPLILYIACMAIFFLMTVPILGLGSIADTVSGPISFTSIKSDNGMFPNVYVSVAELNVSGLAGIITSANIVLFTFMIFSFFYLFFSYRANKSEFKLDTLILLIIWFLGPLYASTNGVRFEILFAAPVALGAGIFISKLFRAIEGEKWSD